MTSLGPPLSGSHALEELSERYEIQSVLGQGGGSIVYYALDRARDNLPVAIKLLIHDEAFDEHVLARFREEVKICSALDHPNLVKAYDLIELEGTVAFTMEHVKGRDLSALLRKGKPSAETVDSLMDQLLSALAALHAHGIVHRDVKLENLLLRDDGVLKLTDLGLMKSPSLAGLTRTGILLGTAQYMPPEYVKQSLYDHRGDVYGAGCVLYELLTGHRRLCDKPGPEALEYLIKTKFQLSKATLNGFPKRFIPIIQRAMEVDHLQRYQSALEMREALRESALRDARGEGVVEMKGALSSPEAMKRLAAVQEKHHTRHVTDRFTTAVVRSLSATLLVLLVVLAGIYGNNSKKSVFEIPPGRYEGVLERSKGVSGSSYPVSLEVPASRSTPMKFTSTVPRCERAQVDRETNSLSCEGAPGVFEVMEQGVDGSGIPYLVVALTVPDMGPSRAVRFSQKK